MTMARSSKAPCHSPATVVEAQRCRFRTRGRYPAPPPRAHHPGPSISPGRLTQGRALESVNWPASGVFLLGAKQDRLASGRDVETVGGERVIAANLINANDNVRMDAQALAA
ncbi:hypothetical protein RCRUDOLPH_61 [Rhodobacter phage RcRudolph]|nr:hypothetical protein RCRUDOLPH_61 [Rhodobacter phage RcRudolph]